jgi:cellulose synthase/poly-beta-1,6-N-acetylglucosamine synthase-like glycosyltransferase
MGFTQDGYAIGHFLLSRLHFNPMFVVISTLKVALIRGHESLKPYPIQCVSIVIPVYNEEESLPELLRRTRSGVRPVEPMSMKSS